MIHRLLAAGLVVSCLSFTGQLKAQGNTGAKMADRADAYAGAAGNDLANEIVVRINAGGDVRLKKLIATDALADGLREKCKDAVRRVVEQENMRLLWQAAPADEKSRRVIVSSIPRNFSLDLGEGLKWDQQVSVSWSLGALAVDDIKPPVKSTIWVSFDLPALPRLGGGEMHIGGGATFRTALEP